MEIPEVLLCEGSRAMPIIGMGTAAYPFASDDTKQAVLDAIEIGYRHFDSASLYGSEKLLGEAVVEAIERGFIQSREELFVTSKLWCNDAHPDCVLPAIQRSLHNLKMDYLDLYLLHMPFSSKPGSLSFPIDKDDIVPLNMKSVWKAMEECQTLGLARAIGVSNFREHKLAELLATAKIPPKVNQVEMNVAWQQINLRKYCMEKGIYVTAYSPLGGQSNIGSENTVMNSDVLKEIANVKGKTVAQIALRWVYEQGVIFIVKSFKKERLKTNFEIFDFELSKEESFAISLIPQHKKVTFGTVVPSSGNSTLNPDDEL